MNHPVIGLDAIAFAAAFPFHLALDRDLRLVQHGAVLGRLLPSLSCGTPLMEHFHIQRPMDVHDFPTLSANAGRLFLLAAINDPRLRLKGQMLPVDGGSAVIFIASPLVTNVASLTALGLTLNDFPIHDPVSDFMLLMQAQAASLDDANHLSAELSRLNADLERRIEERTRSLASTNGELAAKSAALEDLNAQLGKEVHDRERIEAELHVAQKLEAVGQLAAGIAHEINTPVQFVGDNLRFLGDAFADLGGVHAAYAELISWARTMGGGPEVDKAVAAEIAADMSYLTEEVPKAVSQAIEGIDRVATIVRAMKEFSHPDAGDQQLIDINHAIETTLTVARNEYKYVADVVLNLDRSIPPVPCHPGEINQVFLNIIVNAAHAIDDARRSPTADPARADHRGTITLTSRRDGNWAEVTIGDTGTGIPEAIHSRVFDPFFTTKPVGKGTGQGLYLAHSIVVTKHRGTITFTTSPGKGTSFIVRLPLSGIQAGSGHAAA